MKKMIIQTITISLVVFFAFVGNVFASPTILPVAVTNITGESANLEGYVANGGANSIVWFEWSEGASQAAPNIVARQGLYGGSFFRYTLRDLTPGVVYSYRSAVLDDGVTTYSPTGSFRTPVKTGTVSSQTIYQNGQTSGALGIVPYNQTNVSSGVTTQAPTQTQTQTNGSANTNTNTTVVIEKKNTVATTTVVKTDGFTNNNSASVASLGGGVLPSTLIGWVALLIAILIMVLVAVMIYEAGEKRRSAEEQKKKIKKDEEAGEEAEE